MVRLVLRAVKRWLNAPAHSIEEGEAEENVIALIDELQDGH